MNDDLAEVVDRFGDGRIIGEDPDSSTGYTQGENDGLTFQYVVYPYI